MSYENRSTSFKYVSVWLVNIHQNVALRAGSSPNSSRLPQPLFKRVVIMLVDALREDFIFGPNGRTYMPYTRHVVERGSSYSFVAKARPPTVTMPRIKVRWGIMTFIGDFTRVTILDNLP